MRRAHEYLALLEAFLNTRDHEDGEDAMARPTDLDAWLRVHNLATGVSATEADLAAARELREAVRDAVASKGSEAAWTRLAAGCAAFPLRVGNAAAGEQVLVPAGEGARAAVGWLAAAVASARIQQAWVSLKVCPAQGCGWAFIDRSRNGSRRWCEMSSCGNQQKVRAYRARRRKRPPR